MNHIGSHTRWFALTVHLTRTEPATQAAKITVRYARNLGIGKKEGHVSVPSATCAVQPAIPRANAKLAATHAAAQCTEPLRASNAPSTSARSAKAQLAMGPEGTTAPRRRTPICTLCEVTGHDEERCPTRPGPACGCRTHRLPTPLEFPASAHTLRNHAPFRTRRCVH
jgi:hypothetical protein